MTAEVLARADAALAAGDLSAANRLLQPLYKLVVVTDQLSRQNHGGRPDETRIRILRIPLQLGHLPL